MIDARHARRGIIPALFIWPFLFFTLGFVSIYTALSASVCILLPFILLARNKEKTWCRNYCPRASLISLTGRPKEKWRKAPRVFTDGSMRKWMLIYLGINVLFMTASTMRVALGKMESMAFVRLFIVIPLWPLPQLLVLSAPPFLLHLSYRFYSLMLSSTILGIVFSILWRPRLWCAVCPIGNLSNKLLQKDRTHSSQAPL